MGRTAGETLVAATTRAPDSGGQTREDREASAGQGAGTNVETLALARGGGDSAGGRVTSGTRQSPREGSARQTRSEEAHTDILISRKPIRDERHQPGVEGPRQEQQAWSGSKGKGVQMGAPGDISNPPTNLTKGGAGVNTSAASVPLCWSLLGCARSPLDGSQWEDSPSPGPSSFLLGKRRSCGEEERCVCCSSFIHSRLLMLVNWADGSVSHWLRA